MNTHTTPSGHTLQIEIVTIFSASYWFVYAERDGQCMVIGDGIEGDADTARSLVREICQQFAPRKWPASPTKPPTCACA